MENIEKSSKERKGVVLLCKVKDKTKKIGFKVIVKTYPIIFRK